MNWVLFWTLLVLVTGNFAGVIWHHIEDKKDREERQKLGKDVLPWNKDKEFWGWTTMLLICGICFVVLRLLMIGVNYVRNGFKNK